MPPPIDANVIGILCAVMVITGGITGLYYQYVTKRAMERERQKQAESRLMAAIKHQEYLAHKLDQLEEQASRQFDARFSEMQPKVVKPDWTQPPAEGEEPYLNPEDTKVE
jgi:Tfp pilus assembly protein PilO